MKKCTVTLALFYIFRIKDGCEGKFERKVCSRTGAEQDKPSKANRSKIEPHTGSRDDTAAHGARRKLAQNNTSAQSKDIADQPAVSAFLCL